MNLRTTLLAATVLAAPAFLAHTAAAQPVTGPYVSLGGGYDTETQQKAKDIVAGGVERPYEARIGIKNGFTGNGAIGYGFGNGVRVEIEGDYLGNRFDEYKADGADVPVHGTQQQYGAFANVLYDFDLGLPYVFPYVGGGVGWQYDYFNSFSTPGGTFVNKNKGAIAYQGIAGFAVPVPMVPGLSVTADYRFIGLATSRKYTGNNANGLPFQFKAEHEYNNVFEGGLRYVLFQPAPMAPAPTPAPAPVAAPAPAPAKTYLVFFDWDKYNLTPRATQIIAQAASDSKTQNTTTIDVSGYTDTSGTPDYNQGLSERRAKSVAAQLVADGVSESEITIHAFGETHLLVPTGPGVREPQNRRVEIVLQ
jgi:outer membrane protein OmpA-like peptidoglycan-associated protein